MLKSICIAALLFLVPAAAFAENTEKEGSDANLQITSVNGCNRMVLLVTHEQIRTVCIRCIESGGGYFHIDGNGHTMCVRETPPN